MEHEITTFQKIDETLVFSAEVYFCMYWIVKRSVQGYFCTALQKIFFFEILALLICSSTTNNLFQVKEKDEVQKCEEFQKSIFLQSNAKASMHEARRFAIQVKVNFHRKTSVLSIFWKVVI